MERTRVDVWFVLLFVLGALSMANGLWMLVESLSWFQRIAPDVGTFNVHLVRDVGAAYVTSGAALLWAAFRPPWRVPLVAVATLFNVLHAVGHVRETASGELHSHHWLTDLPGVYLPALLLIVLTIMFVRRKTPAT